MGYWSELDTKKKKRNFILLFTIWPIAWLLRIDPLADNRKVFGRGRDRILKPEGCTNNYMCPGLMECLVQPDYETGRSCGCDKSRAYWVDPPHFDDEELDRTFDPIRNCNIMWAMNSGIFFWNVVHFILSFNLAKYLILTLLRVIKNNDKLSFNTTFRCLYLANITHVALAVTPICALITLTKNDPYYILVDSPYQDFVNTAALYDQFLIYELICAWVDLVLRSAAMSKTRTKGAIAFKYFMYALWLFRQIGERQGWFWAYGMSFFYYFIGMYVVDALLFAVASRVLCRFLCKDMKDTSNPNWKAARVILQSAKVVTYVKCQIMPTILAFVFSNAFGPWMAFRSFWWANWTTLWTFVGWAYLHYCVFGFRKHLEQYDSERITEYYGFTTVGINSSIQSVRTAISSIGSQAESTTETDKKGGD